MSKDHDDGDEANPKVSSRSSKAEILSAYEELIKNMQENAGLTEERKASQQRQQEDKILKSAQTHSTEAIIQSIGKMESAIRQHLSSICESLMQEAGKLKTVQEAIQIAERYLQEIHGIKAEADTLANLIQVHRDKKKELEEEFETMGKDLEMKMVEFTISL